MLLNKSLWILFVSSFLIAFCSQNNKTIEGKYAIIHLFIGSPNSGVNTCTNELNSAEEDMLYLLCAYIEDDLVGQKYSLYGSLNPTLTVEIHSKL